MKHSFKVEAKKPLVFPKNISNEINSKISHELAIMTIKRHFCNYRNLLKYWKILQGNNKSNKKLYLQRNVCLRLVFDKLINFGKST